MNALTLSFLLILSYFEANAEACLYKGLVDYNCDGKFKIAITGDSVVYGTGDKELGNRGGYPTRIRKSLPKGTKTVNLGIYSIRTLQLLGRFQSGIYDKALKNADLLIIDLGRNDCLDGVPPKKTVRNLKRIVKYARNRESLNDQKPPFVLVGTQIPCPQRRTCVGRINESVIAAGKKGGLPIILRFDKYPDSVISSDRIHPNSSGYQVIAKKVSKFIKGRLQKILIDESLETP